MFGTDLHVGYEEKVGKKSESFQEYDCGKSRSYMGFATSKSVHLLSCRVSAAIIYCDSNFSYMAFGAKK